MNGMALHGGVLPVGGTFLVFSDYCRPAVRLAALSRAKVIYSFTHDSVGVGEDGPTHQPIEHLAALRAIPNLHVLRPADATIVASQAPATRCQGLGHSLNLKVSCALSTLPNLPPRTSRRMSPSVRLLIGRKRG